MLTVERMSAGYGKKTVLHQLDLRLGEGETATLLGRNGMGKTSTIRAIMGIIRPSSGSVLLDGKEQRGQPPWRIARAGIGLVPEGRQVFPTLTVQENLTVTARTRSPASGTDWPLQRIYALFPRLAQRSRHLGSQLSGGEQQMLAIGRALMTNPKLLILDEATEGLSPLVRQELWACLRQIKQEGVALLVIDKCLDAILDLADRNFIMEKGAVVWTGSSDDLRHSGDVIRRYLGA